jgi:hypothetical protein
MVMGKHMNILIGKYGRSIFFDEKNWSIYAGDDEAPILYTKLAKQYPQHTFYLIGKSDIKKIKNSFKKNEHSAFSFFENEIPTSSFNDLIPNNIINLFDDYLPDKHGYAHNYLEEKIKNENLKFDCGIIFAGPAPYVGIPDKDIQKLDGTKAECLEMFIKYYANIIHVLNITGTPYFNIVTDPRYVPIHSRDVYNDEKFILSQINTKFENKKRISGYGELSSLENLRNVTQTFEYAGVETIFMMNLKKTDFTKMEKPGHFIIALNSAGIASERQKIVEDWLLKTKPPFNVKIYGKWEQDFIDKYPGIFEEKAIRDIEPEFWNARYTFIPPFSQKQSSFVTQKFWKMIYYGIIPFFHPYYDTDKIFNVPDFLRVKTPKQMWERIEYLQNNEQDYRKLLKIIYNILDEKYFSGEYMMNKISESVFRLTGKNL